MQKNRFLPKSYFLEDDVVALSRDLIGKVICTNIDGVITKGIIHETEAYMAPQDKASHAYQNKKAKRNLVMYQEGGCAYVYLCYGLHHLFNIVTNQKDIPHAILIRAIEPLEGIDHMLVRRKLKSVSKRLTSGPGVLSQALGITIALNGEPVAQTVKNAQPLIWVEDQSIRPLDKEIVACARVGIDYAEEYVTKPWRFKWRSSKWTTRPPLTHN